RRGHQLATRVDDLTHGNAPHAEGNGRRRNRSHCAERRSAAVRSTGVHHVDLVVSSIERSLPFYTELLGPLGFHRVSEVEGERGETIWYIGGPGTAIGLREAQSGAAHDRYAVGLHHLAF